MLTKQPDGGESLPLEYSPAEDTEHDDTVDWRGYCATVPPFNEDGSLALDLLRELLHEFYIAGLHGVLVDERHGRMVPRSRPRERRLVAETAIKASTAASGCPDGLGDRGNLVAAHARHAFDAGAAGVASTRRPTASPSTTRSYHVLRGHHGRHATCR